MGIDVEVHMTSGMIFEMQFHAPASQTIKNRQHMICRHSRLLPKDSPRTTEFEEQDKEISS
ncbi:MAG: hypothetical protein WCF04_09640, partial [Candidatus Nanopelagicales bacterium]